MAEINPTLTLGLKRTAEMCAIFMIGNGLVGMTQPRRQIALWRSEVKAIDLLVRRFEGRPNRRRLQGLIQFGAGVLLASRLKRG